jgi:hypothetical protein
MIQYRIARCLGEENVSTAIQDKMDENVGWRVHTIVVTNVEERVVNPLMANQTVQITRFLILFERVDLENDPLLGKDVNPGGLRVS